MTQRESLEFAMEQGNMVQVLMVHCQAMKRQETRLRLATALMLVAFLATLVWIQFHQQTTHPVSGARQEALRTDEASPKRLSVHLTPAGRVNGACPQQQIEQLVQWNRLSEDHQRFSLTNSSVLNVLTEGLYLIDLRISYRISYNQCLPSNKPDLEPVLININITQRHSNYEKEIDVITAFESMPCKQFWLQSVTLNRAITLEANTALRVKINSDTCKFVNWFKNSHLDVTLL